MARAQPRTATKTPKRVARARARIARYTDRQARAETPAEQHQHARQFLMAAVARSRTPDKTAAELARWIDPDVRHLLTRLPETQAQAVAGQLDTPRPPRAHMGQTLAMLHTVIIQLGDEKAHRHYTQELSTQARKLEARHTNRR